MKTMTIRKVPEEVHRAVAGRARRNRRSLNQQVIAELAGEAQEAFAAETKRNRAEAIIFAAEQARESLPRFLDAKEIDAAVKEGRA